jgi:type I restriction enzyme S subunit
MDMDKTYVMIDIIGGAQPSKNFLKSCLSDRYIRLYQIRDYGDNSLPVYIPKRYAKKRKRQHLAR